jgi:hypothetical protein
VVVYLGTFAKLRLTGAAINLARIHVHLTGTSEPISGVVGHGEHRGDHMVAIGVLGGIPGCRPGAPPPLDAGRIVTSQDPFE